LEKGKERDVEKAGGDEGDAKDAEGDRQQVIKEYNSSSDTSTSSPDGKVRINFMHFGDILGSAIRLAYGGNADKKGGNLPIRFLIGPITFKDARTGKWTNINLADVPISLELFTTWWINKVVGPQLDVYTLKNFISDAVQELVVSALGEDCYTGIPTAMSQPPKLNISVISAPTSQDGSDRIAKKGRIGADLVDVTDTPKKDALGNAAYIKPDRHIEYLFIYCFAWTNEDLSGNRANDLERGIYHVSVGQDAGPVKNITFEKEDNEWRNTHAALEGQGIGALAAAYDANISMIGNSLFNIGNYIHVSPSGLGMDAGMAQQLGLGGYYTIAKMTGKIDSAGWTVDAECIPLFTSNSDIATKGRAGDSPAPAVKTDGASEGNNPEKAPRDFF